MELRSTFKLNKFREPILLLKTQSHTGIQVDVWKSMLLIQHLRFLMNSWLNFRCQELDKFNLFATKWRKRRVLKINFSETFVGMIQFYGYSMVAQLCL